MEEEGQEELWLIIANEPIMHLKLLKVLSDFLIQRAIFFYEESEREYCNWKWWPSERVCSCLQTHTESRSLALLFVS